MLFRSELSKRQTGRTLYLLDEPTTGLHFDDVRKLLEVLDRLADLGNSVIIIEHNIDVIRNADWILDLGPEGGEDGGRIIGQGRPAKIAATPGSYTGQFLTRYYASSNGQLVAVDLEEREANDFSSQPAEANAVRGRGSSASPSAPKEPKAKRTRGNTPAEDDLASTRAKANRPPRESQEVKPTAPRGKKTGQA